ncbi:MAG: RNA polymerase subunit sigma-70, partial [Clostridiales bacterium]|nr:RNA polymerase subunit sigma-70 [Clostridiales bacterium]
NMDYYNPCSCEAWISFSSHRNQIQQDTRKKIDYLNYQEKGYLFDLEVRRKISYLYTNMPQEKPDEEWYQVVIANLK